MNECEMVEMINGILALDSMAWEIEYSTALKNKTFPRPNGDR
jgi:hypothetical protein